MGAADIVPGVSGGTIALITGIYEEFINALKSFTSVFGVLKSEGIKAAWKHINGNFLLALFTGIVISLLSLVQFIKYALVEHPILLWSFFFGLIAASCYFVSKEVTKWTISNILALIVGTVLIYFITTVSPAETSTELWFVFLSGMIAICAMILPGISGAFILVLFGKYAYIIEAISNFQIDVIATFGLGCIVGLLSFSHLLSLMLRKYYNFTIAILTGFMIGSLNKIWPWKNTLEWGLDRHGEQIPVHQENVLPSDLAVGESQLFLSISFMVLGLAILIVMEKLAQRKTTA